MAARYPWMFRTAAALFLFFGGVWLWRFGLTDYHPEQRLYGLAAGALSLLVGVFLMRGHKLAIGVSAAAATVVGISAAVFAPNARGPGILFLAGLAIASCLYAVFAVRALREPGDRGGERER
jgi:peptidoglycan/LPS O-acetylase OafA/YrhL